jgi:hypothetical protein
MEKLRPMDFATIQLHNRVMVYMIPLELGNRLATTMGPTRTTEATTMVRAKSATLRCEITLENN